jgi:phage-related minor tail protein
MMMHMLEVGGIPVLIDNIRKADVHNPDGYYEFEPVKRLGKDASWMANARGKAVKIVYRLLYELPTEHEYRVIFMKRKLEEVLASQQEMLQGLNEKGGVLDDAQLAILFRRELQMLDESIRAQKNIGILYVSYNDMVREPTSLLDEVGRFLGRGLDLEAMAKVVDHRLYRQRS